MRQRCVSVSAARSGLRRLVLHLRNERGFVVCRAGNPIAELLLPDSLRRLVKVETVIRLKRKVGGRPCSGQSCIAAPRHRALRPEKPNA